MRLAGSMARVGAFPGSGLTDDIDGRSLVDVIGSVTEAMLSVESAENELRYRLSKIVRATAPLVQVLTVAHRLRLPDWLGFSGAGYQPVLNHLTGRPLDYGIKDYDLAYFDASDLSYESEDVVIRRVKAAFDEPLRSRVEVRNQACISGSRLSSASHTDLCRARLMHWSDLPQRHSRSVSAWNPTTGST